MRRSPLPALAYAAVVVMTLYALALNNLTFATNDYRPIVIEALAVAVVAIVVTLFVWRRVPGPARVALALMAAANMWTIVDAGARRLPALMGW